MTTKSGEPSGTSKSTILVVEDNRSLREGLALNLRMHGYRTQTAADGDEGLRKKLRPARHAAAHIHTIPRVGYKLDAES